MNEILASAAALAAVAVAGIIIRQYRTTTYSAQLKTRQYELMNQVAGLAIELYDYHKTLAFAITSAMKDADTRELTWDQWQQLAKNGQIPGGWGVDRYLYYSMGQGSKNLYKLLDKAVGIGLRADLKGSHKDSQPMWGSFRAALIELSYLNPRKSIPPDFIKQNLHFGLVRLAGQCLKYECLIDQPNTRITAILARVRRMLRYKKMVNRRIPPRELGEIVFDAEAQAAITNWDNKQDLLSRLDGELAVVDAFRDGKSPLVVAWNSPHMIGPDEA